MNKNQENTIIKERIELIESVKKLVKDLETQIVNSHEHLKRNWGLLKDESKNWNKSEIIEIVWNIEKEAEYLGKCKNELQRCHSLLTKHREQSKLDNLADFYQDHQTKKHGV